MPRPLLILAVAAGLGLILSTGCAGSRSGVRGVASSSLAPDDVAQHPNPNAPYMLPGSTPRLIPRATALEARDAGPCDPDVLSVDEIAGNSNGSLRSVKLAFMNRGATPCRLGGYPRIALLGPDGQSIGSIAMEKVSSAEVIAELSKGQPESPGAASPSVTLLPHAVAAFQVVWTSGATCSAVSRILVTAPGTEQTFAIVQPMKICAGRIQVTELRLDEGDV